MKRTEFLKYLRTQGCEFIREGVLDTAGGEPPAKTGAPRSRDRKKSVTVSPEDMHRPWNRTNKISPHKRLHRIVDKCGSR